MWFWIVGLPSEVQDQRRPTRTTGIGLTQMEVMASVGKGVGPNNRGLEDYPEGDKSG